MRDEDLQGSRATTDALPVHLLHGKRSLGSLGKLQSKVRCLERAMYDGYNGKGIVVVTDMVNRRLIQIVQIGNHSSLDKKVLCWI